MLWYVIILLLLQLVRFWRHLSAVVLYILIGSLNLGQTSSPMFCDQCKEASIRLDNFIKEPGKEMAAGKLITLATPSEMAERKECPLCRLLSNACRKGPLRKLFANTDTEPDPDNPVYPVQVLGSWYSAVGTSQEEKLRSPSMCLVFWPGLYSISRESRHITVRPISGDYPKHPYFARPIDHPYIDVDLVRRWLNKCETSHETCRRIFDSRESEPLPYHRVIDVEDHCIVEAQPFSRYVALSYVWGRVDQLRLLRDDVPAFSQPGGLDTVSHRIPATINDAMELTRRLKERYLWVDSLCIVQDDDTVRGACIAAMDRVYGEAIVTIVAGNGTSAEAGLPGISKPREITSFVESVEPGFRLAAHFDFKDHLKHSLYITRGWT